MVLRKKNLVRSEARTYHLWGEKVNLCIPKLPTKDELKALDENTQGCQHCWFTTSSGVKLHYRKYVPEQPPKAIIVYQHPLQGHAGSAPAVNGRKLGLGLLEQYCQDHGYLLYAHDMYGHGFSEGTRMFIRSWEANRDDLMEFCEMAVAETDRNTPFFLVGASFGGNLALQAVKSWQDSNSLPSSFSGLLLLGPSVVGDLPPKPVVRLLRERLAPHNPTWIPFFMPNPGPPKQLWRDRRVRKNEVTTRNKLGIHNLGKTFCLQTAIQLLDAIEEVQRAVVPEIKVPVCALHGTRDAVSPPESSRYVTSRVQTPTKDVELHMIKGAHHDLLADPKAEEVMENIHAFIQRQTLKSTTHLLIHQESRNSPP